MKVHARPEAGKVLVSCDPGVRLSLLFDALAESVAAATDEELIDDGDVDADAAAAVRACLLAATRRP